MARLLERLVLRLGGLGLWLHLLLSRSLELKILLLGRLLVDRLHELLLLNLLLGLWRLDHLLRRMLLKLLCGLTDLLGRVPGLRGHCCLQHLCLRCKLKVGSHDGIRGLRLSLTVGVCDGQRCLCLALLHLWRLLVAEIGRGEGLEATVAWVC